MTGFNLPPGVHSNMIPGNRPEDEAEEAFWDKQYDEFIKQHYELAAHLDVLTDDAKNEEAIEAFAQMARDTGYQIGFAEGRAEEQMAQAMEQTDKSEEQRNSSQKVWEETGKFYTGDLRAWAFVNYFVSGLPFRPGIEDDDPEAIVKARANGYSDGEDAASWLLDGNSSDAAALKLLRGIRDGDPEVLDQLPGSPLSGEYAGEKVPNDVLRDVDLEEDDELAEAAIAAYEDGFDSGVHDGAEKLALRQLGLEGTTT